MELIDTNVMVENKKMFYINSIAIIITIVLFAVLPWLYLTAAVSALILVIINRKFTKKEMSGILKDIDWEIIFFFIALYIVIGCLIEAGFRDLIMMFPFEKLDVFLLCLIILLVVSVLSGLVANTPTALIFIPIIDTLILLGFPPIPLLFALIVGVNLGGNFVPQGAACDMMTLKIAQDSGVDNFTFKRLLKTGAFFATIHLAVAILYLFILVLIFG
jgi:Na+/H+ antiporter NhaD/arsenite permease-like protein